MSSLSFYNLLDAAQIKDSDLSKLFELANKYQKEKRSQDGKDLILATLFFEPSTRTRFSFESAIIRLGGQVITLEQGEASSIKKGESLADMGRIMSNYADIIVMRHPKEGSVAEFAKYATVPVINAGDGANQHPTQSLVDLYTIFCEKKRLDNLKIGVLGDLKHSRTVHSLLGLLSRRAGNSFSLISHPSLALTKNEVDELKQHGCSVEVTEDLTSAINDLDVLYVTRIQQERFASKDEFEKVQNLYQVNRKILAGVKPDMIVLHALPRINEIDPEMDEMPQAKYFAQANYGVCIRMALIRLMSSIS